MRLATLILGAALSTVMAGSALAQTTYTATINAAQEVPTNASVATGSATVILNAAQTQLSVSVNFANPWPGGWWRLRDIVEYEKICARSLLTLAARYHDRFQTGPR